ncbi:asparagine synthase-related protein [Pseudomonas sp. WPR_5_2]|uniref:asparagine synthase-related protein n=1 Tax=Pseudomonas sp. WPR_5_2 TaxID=1907371 RepID=UPI001314304C|nr:asparagine synthase-related protein [Pseudomonas sp. WPR_5_2]
MEFQIGEASNVAVELSGGLDSSTVAITCALSLQSKKTNTYGILISDPTLEKSQKTRRQKIISHINGDDYAVKIKDHLPLISSPAKDRYYLNSEAYGAAFESIWSQAAADGQYAIMNGCGGDELFPQFLEEDFSGDRLRSIDDTSWELYNQLLNDRLTPQTQDILGSHLLPCSPKKIVDTGMLLAMSRRAPLLLSYNLVPLYPFRDNRIIKFCNSLPLHLRLNKTLLTDLLCKKTQSKAFCNYPKETFMHADKMALLKQKELILSTFNKMHIVEIGLVERNLLKRDLEQLTTRTPRYIMDYLLNILAIERFLRAYL